MDWQQIVKARAQADALGMPGATATDSLALMRADTLLPEQAKMKAKKRTPIRLQALQAMFPMTPQRPTDAQGGMV